MAAFKIPDSLQAHALKMHLTGSSARQVWQRLWPTDPPCRVDQFTRALIDLRTASEAQVNNMMRAAGVPTPAEMESASGDDESFVALALYPGVVETPLPPGDDEALAHLDGVRGILIGEMVKCAQDALPDPEGAIHRLLADGSIADEVKMSAARSFGGLKALDQRSVRAGAIATLANAVAANVAQRLAATRLRVDRTVQLHNLMIEKKIEDDRTVGEARREADRDGSRVKVIHAKTGGFVLDMGEDKTQH